MLKINKVFCSITKFRKIFKLLSATLTSFRDAVASQFQAFYWLVMFLGILLLVNIQL